MNQQNLFNIEYDTFEEDYDIMDADKWYQLELFELEYEFELALQGDN